MRTVSFPPLGPSRSHSSVCSTRDPSLGKIAMIACILSVSGRVAITEMQSAGEGKQGRVGLVRTRRWDAYTSSALLTALGIRKPDCNAYLALPVGAMRHTDRSLSVSRSRAGDLYAAPKLPFLFSTEFRNGISRRGVDRLGGLSDTPLRGPKRSTQHEDWRLNELTIAVWFDLTAGTAASPRCPFFSGIANASD